MLNIKLYSGFRDKDVYEYRYDIVAYVVRLFVPDCEYKQTWYYLAGRLTSITHDGGFTQTLHYADGPGTPRYDGMVSAMSWKTGSGETRLRGYRYAYDALGRLTDAVYGENTTLESNPNRYTERVLEYTANGNIRRFQRHGLKDDGVYGKIDNLHLTYDGNQLKSVLDDALPVIRYATADFADLTDSSTEYSYDECGALISDSNQGILSISYDDLGNPRLTQFSSGEQVEYVYTPSGQKVREIHRSPKGLAIGGTLPSPHEMTADTTNYIGPAIYRGGRPEMVRYAGGFASLSRSGTSYVPAFYHYITDYLGNNRSVVRASDGAFVQVTHYYPWGSVYGDMGTGASLQPYKYGDKELDLTAGVARYDYAARAYYAAIPRFDRPDALAGKYPHHSPYIFCANNPVNVVDPSGSRILFVNGHWSSIYGKIIGSSYKGKKYWGSDFSTEASRYFNDYSIIKESYYIDGSSNWGGDMSGKDRYDAGYKYAVENFETLTSGMSVDESFNMVTHSEGAAYGAGVAAALIDNGYNVAKILHLSADEGDEFTTPSQPFTIQIAYDKDWVTRNKIIDGTDLSGIVCKGKLGYFQVHGTTKSSIVFKIASDLENIVIKNYIGNSPLKITI